jgi:uncharacterized membrane protein YfcA
VIDEALVLLPLAGFGAGFVDAVAGGGGLLTVPALLAAGLPANLALGTNKGQAVFGAVSSAVGYYRAGLLRPRVIRWGFPAGVLGSLLGAWLVSAIDPQTLGPVVLVLLLAAAALVLVPRPRARTEEGHSPGPEPRLLLVLVALLIGGYDGFFGPGTGTLLIVAFLWIFRESALSATANAKVVNLASNLAACALFAAKGLVLWRIALPMAVANALGAFVGTRVTLRAGSKFVRAVAVCVALALAARAAMRLWS